MTAPFSKLKKQEIVYLSRHYCRHRHTYIDHYNCWLTENPAKRLGIFDIETSHLKASIGIMLCYKILIYGTDEILGRTITRKEVLSKDEDKQLVKECINDLIGCDRIITFFGSRFDLKYIRTKAVMHGLEFPSFGEIMSSDVYYMVRNRFQLHSNRLETSCQVLLGESNKTSFDVKHWRFAAKGDQKSLKYIDEHCTADVSDTAKLYDIVKKYSLETETSI
jgi:uncharacterized protein YprB with RNaseH-like and TPR domain